MIEFETEQKTFLIGNVRIGGSPGRVPKVLIPSMFYTSDNLVLDQQRGVVDKEGVENQLAHLADITERTGLSTMLDVVATSPEAMDKYIRNLVDMTEFPLLMDGSDAPEVNIAAIETASDAGVLDRVIINSLNPTTEERVFLTAREVGLKNAVLLTFDSDALLSSTKRVELADDLIKKARSFGIEHMLLDTGVLDIPTLGIACKTQLLLKEKFGYPVGNGAHNAISTWKGLVPKFGKEAKKPALVGANIMPAALGADFILIGPAKNADIIYPAIAMVDAALSGVLMENRERPEKPHPRYKIG